MVVHAFYPYDETRVQRQAEALVKRGHTVDVICLLRSTEPMIEKIGRVTAYRIPIRRDTRRGVFAQFLEYAAFLLLAFVTLTCLHLRQRYAVVQVHNLPDFLVLAALVPRLTGSRIILDLHDLMPEFYCVKFDSGLSSLPVRLAIWQEQFACSFAHHVITVTESWREKLIQRGLSPTKCSVVMNLADTRYFQPALSAAGSSGQFRLIYHGQITRRYGLDLLLQAVVCVRPRLPSVQLTIHGRGGYMESICQQIRSLRLEEVVNIHTQFLPLSELARFILSHHVGVVPYRRDVFTDGVLPTKLMEYIAVGLPVIAARTPAITIYFDQSMIEFYTPGDVDDLAHKILYLYEHPARREELARNTSRFNQKYNWATQRERYVDLVEQIVQGKPIALSSIALK